MNELNIPQFPPCDASVNSGIGKKPACLGVLLPCEKSNGETRDCNEWAKKSWVCSQCAREVKIPT